MKRLSRGTHDARANEDESERHKDVSEKPYYEEAQTWEEDVYGAAQRTKVFAHISIVLSLCLAIGSIATVYVLLPLQQTEFVLFETERPSGRTTRIPRIGDFEIKPDEAVRRYFLTKVIQHLEAFDRSTLGYSHYIVTQFLKEELLGEHKKRLEGRIKAWHRHDARVTVEVESIQPLTAHSNPKAVQQSIVRFTTTQKIDEQEDLIRWTAIVSYIFKQEDTDEDGQSADEQLRLAQRTDENPLGLLITGYRADRELPTDTKEVPDANNH